MKIQVLWTGSELTDVSKESTAFVFKFKVFLEVSVNITELIVTSSGLNRKFDVNMTVHR